jgi:carboxymethylenebutenolidase
MPKEQISILTADGKCPSYVLTPVSGGKSPAVIFYMDAGGIRPAMVQMAERLAEAGYVVLLPDLFYRFGPYQPLVPEEVFKGDVMAILGPLMATTDNLKAAKDTGVFLDYLDTRTDVEGGLGAVGFCMGGGMALMAAATAPDRFTAVASFHGGNLATDAPTSPHLSASRLKADVYVAVAEKDDFYPQEMAVRFEKAMTDAGVRYRSETYTGAAHGWMTTDFPTFSQAASDRGWAELLALFQRTLRANP